MAVKHRRMGRQRGDDALADLNEDLRETVALIKEEEGFAIEVEHSPRTSAELAEKFPAVDGRAR